MYSINIYIILYNSVKNIKFQRYEKMLNRFFMKVNYNSLILYTLLINFYI